MSKKERVNKNVVFDECEIFVSFARSIITHPIFQRTLTNCHFKQITKIK